MPSALVTSAARIDQSVVPGQHGMGEFDDLSDKLHSGRPGTDNDEVK
jgi:hypothetical protein